MKRIFFALALLLIPAAAQAQLTLTGQGVVRLRRAAAMMPPRLRGLLLLMPQKEVPA